VLAAGETGLSMSLVLAEKETEPSMAVSIIQSSRSVAPNTKHNAIQGSLLVAPKRLFGTGGKDTGRSG